MTLRPCIMTRPCTGRTNCASPSPQRMTLGIGSAFSASSTRAGTTSASTRPLILDRATTTSPFGVERRSSESTLTPCFLANPAIASGGAFDGGPVTSLSRSSDCPRTSVMRTASLRGVAKTCMPRDSVAFNCLLTRSFSRRPAKASDSWRSDFGGSSSVSISTSSACISASWESRAARESRNTPVPLRARGRARGLCTPRAR